MDIFRYPGSRAANKFLVAFQSNEVWTFSCESRSKPLLESVWILPKTIGLLPSRKLQDTNGCRSADLLSSSSTADSRSSQIGASDASRIYYPTSAQHQANHASGMSSSLQACFLSSTKLLSVVGQNAFIYDISDKKVIHRMQLGLGVIQLLRVVKSIQATTDTSTGAGPSLRGQAAPDSVCIGTDCIGINYP